MTDRPTASPGGAGWRLALAALGLAAAITAWAAPPEPSPASAVATGRPTPPMEAMHGAKERPEGRLTGAPAADALARWRPFVVKASHRFGVPAEWIERVMRAESGGRTRFGGRPITSRAGAMGLMQLMPATWAAIRAEYDLGRDPYDPRANILAGTAYLARLYRQFGYPGLFGAYNAGPARYAAWLAGREPLPAETRRYLARLGAGLSPAAPLAIRGGPAPDSDGAMAPSETPPAAGREPAAVSRPRTMRARLFAVDRTGDTPAASMPNRRARGLFVALSGSLSRSPED